MRLAFALSEGFIRPLPVRVLTNPFERMRGLLGTGRDAYPVLLEKCSSVHTVGMRYPIDIAFLDSAGTVLRADRDVGHGRLVSERAATHVLERPASKDAWPEPGTVVRVAKVPATHILQSISEKGDRNEWD